MHPTQRVEGITTEESRFPTAACLRQAHTLARARAALLALVMGRA